MLLPQKIPEVVSGLEAPLNLLLGLMSETGKPSILCRRPTTFDISEHSWGTHSTELGHLQELNQSGVAQEGQGYIDIQPCRMFMVLTLKDEHTSPYENSKYYADKPLSAAADILRNDRVFGYDQNFEFGEISYARTDITSSFNGTKSITVSNLMRCEMKKGELEKFNPDQPLFVADGIAGIPVSHARINEKVYIYFANLASILEQSGYQIEEVSPIEPAGSPTGSHPDRIPKTTTGLGKTGQELEEFA